MSRSTISTFQLFAAFPDEESARKYLECRLWTNGVTCPECKGKERITARRNGYYRCNPCKMDFTIRTGTIFERSHVPLHKWLYAMYLLVTARKGISSLQLGKEIGITQKSAWFVLHRLREACGTKLAMLQGTVEVDETFFGGEENNRHAPTAVGIWRPRNNANQGNQLYNSQRFWPMVDKNGPVPSHRPELGQCWIWIGYVNPQTGYGQIARGGRYGGPMTAYHAVLEIDGIEVPEGMEPDHLCRTRPCVRTSHLEIVSHAENIRRGIGTGPQLQKAKTHCPSGHPYSGDNLITHKAVKGRARRCRICLDERRRVRREARASQ